MRFPELRAFLRHPLGILFGREDRRADWLTVPDGADGSGVCEPCVSQVAPPVGPQRSITMGAGRTRPDSP